MPRKLAFVLVVASLFSIIAAAQDPIVVGPQPDGSIVVPTHQVLRPAGFQIEFFGRPTDVALHPRGELLAVKGFRDVMLVELEHQIIRHTVPLESGASCTGLVWDRGGAHLYATNDADQLVRFRLDNMTLIQDLTINLPGSREGSSPGPSSSRRVLHSAPMGIVLSGDDKTAYVALSLNDTVAIVPLAGRDGSGDPSHPATSSASEPKYDEYGMPLQATGEARPAAKKPAPIVEIPVGVAPFGVMVVGERLFATNWGGAKPDVDDASDVSADSMVEIDERGIANQGSVSVIDLKSGKEIKQIETGLHPSGMTLSPGGGRLYVACANSDEISVIDTLILDVVETISTRPYRDYPFGSAPNAVSVSPDGKQLYVANGGNNAIAVIELSGVAQSGAGPEKSHIVGQIPTGWYPGDVKLSNNGRMLYVANVKGIGSRTARISNEGAFNSHDHRGSVSVIPVPDATELTGFSTIVDRNNNTGYTRSSLLAAESDKAPVPIPERHGEPSVFKHVVYIIKENRTYDQVLGDMPEGNGDPDLVMFGEQVTPNHHALAREFTLLDNFYCSGILSADGHQWTNEAFVTNYLERSFGGWMRSYPYPGGDALAYASSGFLWDNALAHGLSFRTYGEFVEATIEPSRASFLDCYRDFIDGTNKIKIRGEGTVKGIKPYTCTTTIGFPSVVPDVYRAGEFIKELAQFEKNGQFPNLCMMLLPNDHTTGTREGFPTPQAAVADNDLALGRVVEAISKSRYWKETCIFVVQDDPQAGVDHVDGHRTVAFAISPYTKRKHVDSTHYTQTGMVKTIELCLGLPPMNQFDLAATPMRNCFTDKADLTPYTCRPNIVPLDQMNPGRSSLEGKQLYWAQKSMELPLDDVDMADEDTLNRILWHATRGYETPYPQLAWMKKP